MMWKVVFTVLAALFAVGSSGMVGAPLEVNINALDSRAQDALKFAVTEHNRQSNDLYLAMVQSVTKVQKQVVAGIKYTFTVTMGKTPCRKSNASELCAIHEDPTLARPYECTFQVWEQLWLSKITLLKQECLRKEAAADVGEDSHI